jgi:excisionase family DNA binding protein
MPTIFNGVTFYTVKEVSEILQLSEQSIRKYIRTGKLRGQKIGKPVYIPAKSLNDFFKPSLGEYLPGMETINESTNNK